MMTEPFSFSGCSAVFDQMTEIVGHHVGSWRDGDTVPLHESMMKLAINIITQTNFGAHFKDKTNSFNLHHQYSCVIDELDDVLNGLWTFGSGDEREVKFEQNLRIFKSEMKKIVKPRPHTPKSQTQIPNTKGPWADTKILWATTTPPPHP